MSSKYSVIARCIVARAIWPCDIDRWP